MADAVERFNARVSLFSHTERPRFLTSSLIQIADSFFGRWFRLEGCGHARERKGSRFTVRVFQSLFQ
jgi:hypothetical protein